MAVAEREKRETFCFCCGRPLARKEVAATLTDSRIPEWDLRSFANMTIHIGTCCWESRKQWLQQGIRGAVEREEQSLRQGMMTQDMT